MNNLYGGGIIPTYLCTASCRHCLYGCSPKADKHYIEETECEKLCEYLAMLNCHSMHIGGGEPFLNPEKLITLVRTMRKYNISVDYIETNASWLASGMDEVNAINLLHELKSVGGHSILISVDPFHIEFIPLKKVLKLIDYCEKAGMDYFLWQEQFLHKLLKLDHDKRYSREELSTVLGADYIFDTASHYGLSYNGRALNIAREYAKREDYKKFLDDVPCRNLSNFAHFHVDFACNIIPPACTGLGIETEDFIKNELSQEKYPIYNALQNGGTAALFDYAVTFGFEPNINGYVSKCELCFDIKKHLFKACKSRDLYPEFYYESDF